MASHSPTPAFRGDDAAAAADPGALADRRELALVAVERTRMPMVVTDPRHPDNPIVLANQAFLDLTGYTAGEVIGRNCRFLQGRETSRATLDELRRRLAEGAPQIEVEILNYRKDGSAFWNQLQIDAVHDRDGRLVYYSASQKDMTARRRAEALEASERLLLKEIDHRAMNALALVQSIVRLSRADDIASYAARVLQRVDALARAHRLLGRSGWSGAELGDLVAMETTALPQDRVAAHGSPATVPARLVQPVTLVLQELASNALRHGALGRSQGRLEIAWEAAPDRIAIHWRETGGERPAEAPSSNFGLSMVAGVIERQLGGRFEPHWHRDGLEARLSIPIRPHRPS